MVLKLTKNQLSILSLHHDSHRVDDEPEQKPPAPPDPRADDQDRVGDEAQGAAHHHDPLTDASNKLQGSAKSGPKVA